MSKKRIAIFASGEGSNFEAIVSACERGEIPADCVLMVCDRPGAQVIERAGNHGIETLVLSPKSFATKAEMESLIVARLDACGVDLVCLAGYMRIVGETLLSSYEGRIINIHPSLLPSFAGAKAVEQAINYGVKVFGVTIHYVNSAVDGGRIIAQQAFAYDGNDIDQITEKIHAIEHQLYPKTIAKLL